MEKHTYLIEFYKYPNSQLKVIKEFKNVKRIEKIAGVAFNKGEGFIIVEPPKHE